MAACTVSSVQQAMEMYKQIEVEEEKICLELDQLLEQQSQMDIQINSFNKIIPQLESLQDQSQTLSSSITKASNLASSISHKVRTLDTAKRNVYAALKRVEDVIDLKNCVSGVKQAMDCGDFEMAAGHIRRYLDLDETVLLESSADIMRGDTVSGSFALLKQAEVQLRGIVRDRLTCAVHDNDKQNIERFVKLFPLLNLHEEGINLLTKHLNNEIKEFSAVKLKAISHTSTSDKPNNTGIIFADTLMSLYEMVASKFDEHLSLISSCYGVKWIVEFIKKLQVECDKQVEIILQLLTEERMLEHKTQTISIALNTRHTAGAIRPDPKELDALLTELSLCSSRTELYHKFIIKKSTNFEAPVSEIKEVLKGSDTTLKIQEIIGWYILIENYFMRESLSKAISVDHRQDGELISSLPDDAFFVFQKSLKRSFASSNVDGACAMINNTSSFLLKEFKNELEMSLTADQPKQIVSGISDLPSMFQTSSNKSSLSKSEQRTYLAVSCCNIEVTCINLKRLIQQLQNEIQLLSNNNIDEIGKAKLDTCLAELCSTTGTFQELRMNAITYYIESIMLTDVSHAIEQFSTVSHVIEEDVMNDEEFVQKVALSLSQVLDETKAHLLQSLFDDTLLLFATEVADILEKQIFKSNFNQLGGVKLDHDLRQLISFLSNKTEHPLRDKFTRIMQMATILSIEKVNEVSDYYNVSSGPVRWHLSSKDIRGVLHLRRDFRAEDIDSLKLLQSTK